MLRGALIGVGNAAMNGHVPAFCTDPWLREKVEIVAAADRAEENLAKIRAYVPALATYRDAEAMLDAGKLDFIDICTPPHAHLDLIRLAAQRGCHILCEKPLATRWHDGLEIQRLMATRSLVFMPCHQYHFSPLWQCVQQLLRESAIGEIRLAQFEVFRLQADSGNERWQSRWRTNPNLAGGGIIFDIGTHYFYLAFALFGLPERVSARLGRLAHADYAVEDTALIVLEYASFLVQINLTWAAAHRENRTRLIGSQGDLELRGDAINLQRGAERQEWCVEGASNKAAYPQWYGRLFKEFVRHIEAGSSAAPWLQEALNTLRCAERCYRSAQTSKSYRLAHEEN